MGLMPYTSGWCPQSRIHMPQSAVGRGWSPCRNLRRDRGAGQRLTGVRWCRDQRRPATVATADLTQTVERYPTVTGHLSSRFNARQRSTLRPHGTRAILDDAMGEAATSPRHGAARAETSHIEVDAQFFKLEAFFVCIQAFTSQCGRRDEVETRASAMHGEPCGDRS